MPRNLKFEDYTVAWICALEIELQAARVMLDQEHAGNFPAVYRDGNNYVSGQINGHNVVIAGLAKNNIENISAAIRTCDLDSTSELELVSRGKFWILTFGSVM